MTVHTSTLIHLTTAREVADFFEVKVWELAPRDRAGNLHLAWETGSLSIFATADQLADIERAISTWRSSIDATPTVEGQKTDMTNPVPHIDFSTPTGNELVGARIGYGLTPPAGLKPIYDPRAKGSDIRESPDPYGAGRHRKEAEAKAAYEAALEAES